MKKIFTLIATTLFTMSVFADEAAVITISQDTYKAEGSTNDIYLFEGTDVTLEFVDNARAWKVQERQGWNKGINFQNNKRVRFNFPTGMKVYRIEMDGYSSGDNWEYLGAYGWYENGTYEWQDPIGLGVKDNKIIYEQARFPLDPCEVVPENENYATPHDNVAGYTFAVLDFTDEPYEGEFNMYWTGNNQLNVAFRIYTTAEAAKAATSSVKIPTNASNVFDLSTVTWAEGGGGRANYNGSHLDYALVGDEAIFTLNNTQQAAYKISFDYATIIEDFTADFVIEDATGTQVYKSTVAMPRTTPEKGTNDWNYWTTNENADFVIPALAPGLYTFRIKYNGQGTWNDSPTQFTANIKNIKFETIDIDIIGELDNTTGWWTAFSKYYTIYPNNIQHIEFYNYSDKANNWDNFLVVLANVAGHTADPNLDGYAEGYAEYFVVRADNYGWGTNYDETKRENNWDWSNFTNILNGAYVKLDIARNGGEVTVNADVLGSDGNTYFQKYVANIPDAEAAVVAFLSVEKGHLIVDNEKSSQVENPAASGIENVRSQMGASGVRYNLAGQKVSASYKGVVIENGKKFIVK